MSDDKKFDKTELQAMFDDVISVMSDVMPNFTRDGLILIASTQSEAELIELEAYINFKQSYGEESAKHLLAANKAYRKQCEGFVLISSTQSEVELVQSEEYIKFIRDYGEESAKHLLAARKEAKTEELQAPHLENFWSHEVFGYFGADGIANVWVHWITEQPQHFELLLRKYPGVLSLLHERNSAVVWCALEEAIEAYRPSAVVLAEYMAVGNSTEKVLELIGTACSKLAGFGTAVGCLKNEEKKKVDANGDYHGVNSVDSISLDISLVNAKKEERAKQRALGANAVLTFLMGDNKEQLANEQKKLSPKTKSGLLASIHECNRIALELAILEGKEKFETIVVDQKKRKLTMVSAVIGYNSVGRSALERLKIVDDARAKAQKFLWLEFIVNIKQKAVEKSKVNGRSAVKKIYQYNQAALELAIIKGEESFWAVVPGQEEKKLTKVLFAIGRSPVGKSVSERLSMADQMEMWQDRRLQKCINELRNKLERISEVSFAARNQIVLQLAILDGKNTFEMMMKDKKQEREVSSLLGVEPRKMTVLQRLETVDNIEALKVKQANKLLNEAAAEMQQYTKDLRLKPTQAKAKDFRIFSEAHAIATNAPTYPLSPEDGPTGEHRVGQTPVQDGKNGLQERLESFRDHCEKNEKVVASKAVKALISFIDTITHLPRLVEMPKLKKARSVPNVQKEYGEVMQKSLSNPDLLNPKLTEAAGAGTLFQRKLRPTAIEEAKLDAESVVSASNKL